MGQLMCEFENWERNGAICAAFFCFNLKVGKWNEGWTFRNWDRQYFSASLARLIDVLKNKGKLAQFALFLWG